MYHIPNIEVDRIRHHTQAYLKSIGQIYVIYKISISRDSQRRTQPYGDDQTLTSNIDNLIIDTISKIRQPIADITHSETFEDPKFQNPFGFSRRRFHII